MDEKLLEVGDYVKFPLPKKDTEEESEYLYGTVIGFDYGGSIVEIELSNPYKGDSFARTPTYLPKKIASAMYNLGTRESCGIESTWKFNKTETGCLHKWEITGVNPNTEETWYNCEHCNIKKEEV